MLQNEPVPQTGAGFQHAGAHEGTSVCVGNARPVILGQVCRGKGGVQGLPLWVWVSGNKLQHTTPSEGSKPAMRCPQKRVKLTVISGIRAFAPGFNPARCRLLPISYKVPGHPQLGRLALLPCCPVVSEMWDIQVLFAILLAKSIVQ